MRIYLNHFLHDKKSSTEPKVCCDGAGHYSYSDKAEIWYGDELIAIVETGNIETRNHNVKAWVRVVSPEVDVRPR